MGKKEINISVIILSVIILIASFLLISKARIIKNTLDKITTIKDEISDLNEKLVYLKGYEKNSEEMLDMLDKYNRALPESAEENNVILELSKLASNNTIKLNEIIFDESKEENTLRKLPLSINLTGEYFDLIRFISGIIDNQRIFVVKSLSINRDGDSEKIIADIDANTYNILKK